MNDLCRVKMIETSCQGERNLIFLFGFKEDIYTKMIGSLKDLESPQVEWAHKGHILNPVILPCHPPLMHLLCGGADPSSPSLDGPGTGFSTGPVVASPVPWAMSSAGKDAMTEECAKNSNPGPCQSLQPHKHHHALTFAIQMRLNMTSSIPVDKPLNFLGHVPRFCELWPPILMILGKEVQPAPLRASLYQNSIRDLQVSREVLSDGAILDIPGRINPENIFLPAHDPVKKIRCDRSSAAREIFCRWLLERTKFYGSSASTGKNPVRFLFGAGSPALVSAACGGAGPVLIGRTQQPDGI